MVSRVGSPESYILRTSVSNRPTWFEKRA